MRRAALALGLAVCASAARAQTVPTFGSPTHFTEQGGAAIYGSACAGCHMPDARGAAGAGAYPALAGDGRLEQAGYPVTMVLRGAGAMPGFGRTLSDQQVADVVGYVRTHFGNAYADPVDPADVAAARR